MDTYDFSEKALYRSRRETAIDRMLTKPIPLRRVAYLDTGEAIDTLSYLRRGYKAENLWPINNNPVECAVLTKAITTAGWPKVNTVGLDFEDALQRRVPEVDVIDFDGMSCLHDKLVGMFSRVSLSRPRGIMGVTLLGGRESDSSGLARYFILNPAYSLPPVVTSSYNSKVNSRHLTRISIALDALCGVTFDDGIDGDKGSKNCLVHIDRVLWDSYRSSAGQPMVWFVCSRTPHRQLSYNEAKRAATKTFFSYSPLCLIADRLARRGIFGQGLR